MPTPLPTPAPTPATFYPYGCFLSETKFLTKRIYYGAENTQQSCANLCAWAGYTWAGVEYGKECWCGHSIKGAVKTVSTDCKEACTGDAGEYCGDAFRVNLLSLVSALSQPVPSAVGCFAVDKDNRVMTHVYTSYGNTVKECTSVCGFNGYVYVYAGLEYGDECWCGNTLPVERLVSSQCDRPCSGDPSETCGNGYRESIYLVDGSSWEVPAHTYKGCYADSQTNRALPRWGFDDDACTVEECVALCAHNGYKLAGLQYRRQCWCGNTISSSKVSEYQCRLPCAGDSTEICGFAYRNSVYTIG